MNRKLRCSALLFLLFHFINYAQPHETEYVKTDCKKSNKTCLTLFSMLGYDLPTHNHSSKAEDDNVTTHAPMNATLDVKPLLLRDKKYHQPSRNVSKGHAKGQATRHMETCWPLVYVSALCLFQMLLL